MRDRARVELSRTLPEADVSGADRVIGIIELQAGTTITRFHNFDVEILRYLANWEIVGLTRSNEGEVTFSLAINEQTNMIELSIDTKRWAIPTAENLVRVINEPSEGQLSVTFLKPVFSTNEGLWRINANSVIYARDEGTR